MKKIRLVPSNLHPDLLAEPLKWSIDLWGEGKEEFSVEDWKDFYKRVLHSDYQVWNVNSEDKELLFLIMPEDSTELLGVIGLCDFDDLEEFRHYKPWICGFVVREDLRGKGLGRQIMNEMELLIKDFGIKKIYLWTEDQVDFYKKLEYKHIDELKKNNRYIQIMSKELP